MDNVRLELLQRQRKMLLTCSQLQCSARHRIQRSDYTMPSQRFMILLPRLINSSWRSILIKLVIFQICIMAGDEPISKKSSYGHCVRDHQQSVPGPGDAPTTARSEHLSALQARADPKQFLAEFLNITWLHHGGQLDCLPAVEGFDVSNSYAAQLTRRSPRRVGTKQIRLRTVDNGWEKGFAKTEPKPACPSISTPAADGEVSRVPSYSRMKNRGVIYIRNVNRGFYDKQIKSSFLQWELGNISSQEGHVAVHLLNLNTKRLLRWVIH